MASELESPLLETVQALGFSTERWIYDPPKIISAAPPAKLSMGRTYQEVNDELGALLDRGPIRLQHITGEARALVDPAHRRILRRAAAEGHSGELGCYFEWTGKLTAVEFFRRQRIFWGPASSIDLIDILSLLAQGTVDLFVLSEPQSIHFSLFGPRHVLLQDKHHHPTEEKWVWFIECPKLVEHLRLHVEDLFTRSFRIKSSSFDHFLSTLFAYETVEIARRLTEPKELPLPDYFSVAEDQQRLAVAQMIAIGFATEEALESGCIYYRLTDAGLQWLREILNGNV